VKVLVLLCAHDARQRAKAVHRPHLDDNLVLDAFLFVPPSSSFRQHHTCSPRQLHVGSLPSLDPRRPSVPKREDNPLPSSLDDNTRASPLSTPIPPRLLAPEVPLVSLTHVELDRVDSDSCGRGYVNSSERRSISTRFVQAHWSAARRWFGTVHR
jgi:hypothetical protein